MNHYGALAQRHWQTWLPQRYAAIQDPNSFFSTLGEEAAAAIATRAAELAGADEPGEGYLAKLGRLNSARQMAEEEILPELVLLPPEPGSQSPDEDEDEESPQEESSTETAARDEGWIPIREDPTHPFWQAARDSGDLDDLDETANPPR